MYYLYVIIAVLLSCVALLAVRYAGVVKKYKKKNDEFEFMMRVFEAAPISIFVLDKNKYIVNIFNIEPSAMAGHSVSDIVGKHLSHFVDDKESPFNQACTLLNQSFDKIIVDRQTDYFQYMINDAYLVAKIKLIEGDHVVSIVSDVTEHTRRVNDLINRKQQEVNIAFRAGGLTSWSYDVENGVFDSLLGNNVISAKMPYKTLLNKIRKQDRDAVDEAFRKIIEDGETHAEFTAQTEDLDGLQQWSKVHAVPTDYDENGKVRVIMGSQKNITRDVETVEELVRLRNLAEESNRMKSAFIANMSHEIRTPLNAIIGFSNLILSADSKEEAAEYFNVVEQNNALLLNIINDVLDLSKIESSLMRFHMSKVNLYALLNNLSEITKVNLNEGVEMVLDYVPVGLEIDTDSDKLTQVLMNLLGNARKFTLKGEIHLGCEYNAARNMMKFYVKDTGVGIKEEDMGRIFDRFVKVDNFIQGTGLGLSICESIVKYLEGEIGVESKPGVGSTFWFQIPAHNISKIG